MANWYYADGDQRQGPVEVVEIERLIRSGQITGDTLVWREGLAGWEPASEHFLFGAASPPPLSGASPMPGPSTPPPSATPQPSSSAGFYGGAASSAGSDQIGADGLYIGAPGRSFGEAISVCFSKYVTFSGRASRSEYWFFFLFLILAGIGTTIVDAIIFPGSLTSDTGGPVNAIFSLATLLPSLSVSWRRLHDTDRSGWWIGGFLLAAIAAGVLAGATIANGTEEAGFAIIVLLALGGLIYYVLMIVFFCQKGTPGPNRFG